MRRRQPGHVSARRHLRAGVVPASGAPNRPPPLDRSRLRLAHRLHVVAPPGDNGGVSADLLHRDRRLHNAADAGSLLARVRCRHVRAQSGRHGRYGEYIPRECSATGKPCAG